MEYIGEMFGGGPYTRWAPVVGTSSVYVGQLVYATDEGVDNLGTASGAADTTNKRIPMGLILAISDNLPTYDTTNKTNKGTAVLTQAAQVVRSNIGVEGVYAKNDPQLFVQIALLTPNSILKAPLYNATLGTAPTVQTVTTGSTDGLGYTANATDVAGADSLSTAFCRSGANAGLYRITDDTSTTVITNDRAFPQDIAVGDTFVRVPLREVGHSYVQTDSSALFFNVAAAPATDYWVINTIVLNLAEAGKEHVIFTFNHDHFCKARA